MGDQLFAGRMGRGKLPFSFEAESVKGSLPLHLGLVLHLFNLFLHFFLRDPKLLVHRTHDVSDVRMALNTVNAVKIALNRLVIQSLLLCLPGREPCREIRRDFGHSFIDFGLGFASFFLIRGEFGREVRLER